MSAVQQNFLVLIAVVGVALVLALLVGLVGSRSLRDEGILRAVKRWFGA